MFTIVYEEDFNYSKTSQNIYSTFFVKCNDIEFPDREWLDFPFAVLKMWCEKVLTEVIEVQNSEFSLYFMDGPFYIYCIKNDTEINMQFINNRKNKIIQNEVVISTDEFIREIIKVSSKLIYQMKDLRIQSINDIDSLKGLIHQLKRKIRKFKE